MFLARFLPESTFSQVTMILGLMSTYLLLVDLGLQSELVRRLSHGNAKQIEANTVHLRLFGAAIGCFAIVIHGFLADVSSESRMSFFWYGLSLFPAALLYNDEAKGYARQDILRVNSLRFSRAFSMLFFVAVLWWAQRQQLNVRPYYFGIYFAVMSAVAMVLSRKQLHLFLFNLKQVEALNLYVRQVWNLFAGFLLWWAFYTLFSVLNIRAHGEEHLSAFNIAQILIIPLSLLVQVVLNTWIGKQGLAAFTEKRGSQRISMLHFVQTRECWGSLGFVILYASLLSTPGFISFFFKEVTDTEVLRYFWPLSLTQWCIAITSLMTAFEQSHNRWKYSLYTPLKGLIFLVVSSFVWKIMALHPTSLVWIMFFSLLLALFA